MSDKTMKNIENLTKSLLKEIGENPKREGLVKTPHRVAKAWGFLSQGYRQDIKTLINNAVFEEEYDPSIPAILGDFELLMQAFHNLIKNFDYN